MCIIIPVNVMPRLEKFTFFVKSTAYRICRKQCMEETVRSILAELSRVVTTGILQGQFRVAPHQSPTLNEQPIADLIQERSWTSRELLNAALPCGWR
jgi:hypothetical protein